MNYRTQDAEFCGKVPLTQTNLVQPHGVLLVASKTDLTILQVSENAAAVFNEAPTAVLGTPLSKYITPSQAQQLKRRTEKEQAEGLPFSLTIGETEYLSLLHIKQDYLVLELELPFEKMESLTFIEMYQELKSVMADVEGAGTTQEACASAIKDLKRLTGFDKIMIYRFDEEWNGTVIAEAAEEGMDKYLGLRFPASDVPKQARDLYFKNPYRFIPNASYTPVKLLPLLNPVTNAFTDLSETNLRSVAPVHVEYLKNMGVQSSMSTRIILDGRLWGLIACHHREPKYMTYELCFVFELVSNIISAKMASAQKADAAAYNAGLVHTYQGLLEHLYQEHDLQEGLKKNAAQILNLIKADGLALIFRKQVYLTGSTPTEEQIGNLVFWLRSQGMKQLYYTANLSENYADAETFANTGSGLLALPVEPEKGTYVLAFRRETVQKVDWGGNPNEAINFEPDKKAYHPRNSFKIWQETLRNVAQPWTREELAIAERFRNVLIELTLNKKA